jgi:NADH dehydrogenase (ubiquinone) Fe-S protein 1
MRDRMWDVSPTLVRYGEVERPSSVLEGIKALRSQGEREKDVRKGKDGLKGAFRKPIENLCVFALLPSFLFLPASASLLIVLTLFPRNSYRTDPISRSSVTMGKCTKAFVEEQTSQAGDAHNGAAHV